MRDYESEMSKEDLQLANSLLRDLGIEGKATVNELFNEIARIAKSHIGDGDITFGDITLG